MDRETSLHFGMPSDYSPGSIERTDEGWYVVSGDNQFGQWVKDHRNLVHDPEFVRWCSDWISPSTIAVDIGANIGTHTVPYLQRNPSHLVAIEPGFTAFECLRRNILLGFSSARAGTDLWCYCCGCGEDFMRLGLIAENGAPGMNYVVRDVGRLMTEVDIFPLDTLLEPCSAASSDNIYGVRVSLIKIDVEGYEPFVIAGARKTLSPKLGKGRPTIVLEVNTPLLDRNGWTGKKLFQLMESIQYKPLGKWPPELDKLNEDELFKQPQFEACFVPV